MDSESGIQNNLSGKKRIFNVGGAVLNIINTVIGVGIITLPKTFEMGGYIYTLLLSVFCVLLIMYTSDLMVKSYIKLYKEKNVEVKNYAQLCKETLGSFWFYVLTGITFIMMQSVLCVYCVILKQMMQSIISDFTKKTFVHDKLLLLGVLTFTTLPLCLLPKISKLGYVSLASTGIYFIIVFIVIARSPAYNKYMKELSPSKAMEVEKNLNIERAIFICEKSAANADLYLSPPSEKFIIHKVENYRELYKKIDSNLCGLIPDTDKILAIVKKADEGDIAAPKFENTEENNANTKPFPRPSYWKSVVAQAHGESIFWNYSLQARERGGPNQRKRWGVIGVYSSVFIIQQGVFTIFSYQLGNKTIKEWRITQAISFVPIFLLNMALGLSGFMAQKHLVGETVFDKMQKRFYVADASVDYAVNIARILLVISLLFTYAMQCFFGRENFFLVFYKVIQKTTGRSYDPVNPPKWHFYIVTFLMFAVSLLIGVFLDKILLLYTFMGTLLSVPLIYIFPVLCSFAVKQSIHSELLEILKSKRVINVLKNAVLPLATLIFGIIVAIVSTIMSALDAAN